MPASHLPTYVVKILTDALLDDAYLAVAGESDIAEISLVPGFKCDWMALWSNADFDCEALVKLTYQGKIQGIVKFALYPYPAPDGIPRFTEILNIESLSGARVSSLNLERVEALAEALLDFKHVGDLERWMAD